MSAEVGKGGGAGADEGRPAQAAGCAADAAQPVADASAWAASAAGVAAGPATADVSVVVPVCNVEPYIARCLDSLLAQTMPVREIICVDDASADGSLAVLRAYERRWPERVRVLCNPCNMGLGATRDVGVRAARGEFLMFVDSDDWVQPGYVEAYLRAMCAQPCDILIGGYQLCGPRGQEVRRFPHSSLTLVLFSAAWAKLFRRSFVVDCGLEFGSIRYAEDTYLSLCALAQGARCGFIDYAGYCYWQGPLSLTRGCAAVARERDLAAVYEAFAQRFPLEGLAPELRQMVEFCYVADMLNTLLMFGRGCGWQRMSEALAFFQADLQQRFPAWRRNPYVGFSARGRRSQAHARARWGVAGFALLSCVGLGRLPFRAAAVLGRRRG